MGFISGVDLSRGRFIFTKSLGGCHGCEAVLIRKDLSNKRESKNWRPPGFFSRVDRFDFTDGREELLVRSLPVGPRGFNVVEFVSSGHESLTTEYQKTAVVIPIRGTLQVGIDGNEICVRPGSYVAFGPIRRKTRVTPDAEGVYRSLSLIAPPPTSTGAHRDAALLPSRWIIPRDGSMLKPTVDFIEYLFGDISTGNPILQSENAHASAEALVSDLYRDLIEADNVQKVLPKDNASRLVSLALDYMREHYANPIAVGDIAEACRVSVRTLQLAFRSAINISPRQALTSIRVERARMLLQRRATQTTVTSAAHEVGFNHVGRFAHVYCVIYGEHPSDTLRRRSY